MKVDVTALDTDSATTSREEISARILIGYRSPNDPYVIAGLGGYGVAYSIASYHRDSGWTAFAWAGSKEMLKCGVNYRVEVEVIGQKVRLSVNGIKMLEETSPHPVKTGQVGLFTWGSRQVNFTNPMAEITKPDVFVVMQFTDPYHYLYTDVIKPVVAELGLHAYHVGEVFGPGFVINDIQRGISEARIVIADITPMNQNVFYELGFAHALRKPTILMAERGKTLPFDTAPYRCLFYENTIGGKKSVEDALRKHLRAILAE